MKKEDAIALAETKWWEDVTDEEIVRFQLFEDKLCMPFGRFHEAVEKVLGRPVFTHEFAFPELLIKEIAGEKSPATFEDILNLIPAEKRIVITV